MIEQTWNHGRLCSWLDKSFSVVSVPPKTSLVTGNTLLTPPHGLPGRLSTLVPHIDDLHDTYHPGPRIYLSKCTDRQGRSQIPGICDMG